MSDGRRKLKLDDGLWRYTVAEIRGEWWESKVLLTLWTPAGRKLREVMDLSELPPKERTITPGKIREFIERNRETL